MNVWRKYFKELKCRQKKYKRQNMQIAQEYEINIVKPIDKFKTDNKLHQK